MATINWIIDFEMITAMDRIVAVMVIILIVEFIASMAGKVNFIFIVVDFLSPVMIIKEEN